MLRKTQHQRASMKRNQSDTSASSPTNGNVIYHNNNSVKVNFDFDENDNFPSPPPVAPRVKSQAPVPSERTLSFGEKTVHDVNCSSEDLDKSVVQEEIQPGFVLTYNVLEQQEAEIVL